MAHINKIISRNSKDVLIYTMIKKVQTWKIFLLKMITPDNLNSLLVQITKTKLKN